MAAQPQTAQPNPAHVVPLPPAIRRQAERADALQREATGQTTPENPPEPAGDHSSSQQTPVQPAPPAEPPAGPVPGPPAPVQPPPQPDHSAEMRMVQGRLDAERERSQGLANQINNLNRMVEQLQQQLRQPPPAGELPRPPKGKLVTPEEEADYGADLMKVMGKRARDEVQGEIDDLKNEITVLKSQLSQVGQRVNVRDEGDLFTQLQSAVPDWINQNADPEFIAWLQLPEPWSGIKRHDLLARAFDLKDAPRVIRFFQGYLEEAAATGQRPQTTPAPSSPPATNGKVPLETFAAPGRAAPAPASAPPGQKPTYTRAYISQFFTDKAAGKWRGREVDAANIEADIFRAGPEGRVIG